MKENADNIRKELRSIAPNLEDLPKETGMRVPDGFFDSLTDQVIQEASEPKVRSLSTGRRVWMYAAAAIALIVVVSLIAIQGISGEDDLLAEMTDEQAYDFVYANIDEFESTDLVDLMDEENIDLIFEIEDEELDDVIDELLDDINIEMLEDLL